MSSYFTPRTPQEAVDLLTDYLPNARVIAGGTDLVSGLHQSRGNEVVLIDVTSIESMADIEVLGDGSVRLGAGVTHAQVCASSLLRGRYPALWEASSAVGSAQVRNLGTVAGNLCNASPAADTAPPLLALDATVVLMGPYGRRTLPLTSFFVGPKQTALGPAEIMTEILLPRPELAGVSAYVKLGRRKAMDLALVSAAVAINSSDGSARCTIALGSVAPTPVRAREAENRLHGERLSVGLLNEAAGMAVNDCHPITDVRGTARYRALMIPVVTERALTEAWDRLRRLS